MSEMDELNELNEAKEFDESILNELNLEYEKYKNIIDCLNVFEKIINEDFCCTLTIDKRDKFVVFILAKKKIEYIKDALLNPNSLEAFGLKVFELLFMGENKFDYAQLDKKINLFQIILQTLMDEPMEDQELIYMKEVINKKKDWKGLIEMLNKHFGFVAFIFSVFLDFAKSNRQIIEFLLDLLRLMHKYDFKVNFDVNNINDFNEANAAEDFLKLFNDKTEFFYLNYENRHIVKKLLAPDETMEALNELPDDGSIPQKKKKKKKNKKAEKKNEEKTEDKKNDGEYDSVSKINNIDEEAELEKEDKKEDNQYKIEMKEIKTNKEDDILIRLNAMEEEIKRLNSENEKLKKENLVSKLNAQKMQKEIDAGKLNYQKMKKEMDANSQKMQKEIDAGKLNSQKMKKKLHEVEDQLDRVKTDLNLIKSRGAIKIFIDFFYKGMDFKDKPKYPIKVKRLLAKLNNYYKNENDTEIVTMVKNLLKNSAIKLRLGNIEAHNLDKTKPLFAQLFRIIDPDGNYVKVERRLNYIKADNIIKNILEVREDYYFNKAKKEEKEKAVSSEISPETIYSIFVK
jgi:hypothetical protein